MFTADERETNVTWGDADDTVRIWSAVRKHVRAMERDDRFTRIDGDGEAWGSYTVPKSAYDPVRGLRRRTKPMTDAQREAATERLRQAREDRI